MKFSRLEYFNVLVTAVAIAFMAGWFFCGQYQASRFFVPSTAEPTVSASPSPTVDPDLAVNINTAGIEELTSLPGIGEKRAADIIAYREENGPFRFPEAITDVPGIGTSILGGIIDRITVED